MKTLRFSDIKEVKGSFGNDVNEKLATGDWVLIDARIIQTENGWSIIYILGRIE